MPTAKSLALRIPPLRRLVEQRDALARDTQRLQARNATLERDVARLGSAATTDDSGLGYLFIVTYGRTGSTLLNGIVNSIPGYTIRGENAGALEYIYPWWADFTRRFAGLAKKDLESPTYQWFGAGPLAGGQFAPGLRRYVVSELLRPEPGTRVTGFKEVRWWKNDLVDVADFMSEVFPGARFLLLTRNRTDVMKSGWWASREPEVANAQLESRENRMADLAAHLGDRGFQVHYDDFVADPGTLEAMFDWLGEPFDRARVDEVMAVRHSYRGAKRD